MFMEIIETYGMEIIGSILTALAAFLGVAIKRLATKYLNTKTKQDVARTVVLAVEQIYKDLHGEEKLTMAMEAAADMLQEAGVTVTDLELRMLLEAAVGEFNAAYNSAVILPGVAIEDEEPKDEPEELAGGSTGAMEQVALEADA